MSETRIQGSSDAGKSTHRPKRSATKAAPAAGDQPERASSAASVVSVSLSAIDRDAMIATSAYFRAQGRNFEAGHELEDWLAAESEIDAALLSGL